MGERRFYIGARLKALRESKGISQLDLALKIGKRPETVWRWENNESAGIKRSDCAAIAKALDTNTTQLIGVEELKKDLQEAQKSFEEDIKQGAEKIERLKKAFEDQTRPYLTIKACLAKNGLTIDDLAALNDREWAYLKPFIKNLLLARQEKHAVLSMSREERR